MKTNYNIKRKRTTDDVLRTYSMLSVVHHTTTTSIVFWRAIVNGQPPQK